MRSKRRRRGRRNLEQEASALRGQNASGVPSGRCGLGDRWPIRSSHSPPRRGDTNPAGGERSAATGNANAPSIQHGAGGTRCMMSGHRATTGWRFLICRDRWQSLRSATGWIRPCLRHEGEVLCGRSPLRLDDHDDFKRELALLVSMLDAQLAGADFPDRDFPCRECGLRPGRITQINL